MYFTALMENGHGYAGEVSEDYDVMVITSVTRISREQWWHWVVNTGLILGLRPANERRRYIVTTSHWLGTSLKSALKYLVW